MADQTSTLTVGVRTDRALQNLEALNTALRGTIGLAGKLQQVQKQSSAYSQEVTQAHKTLAREVEQSAKELEKSYKSASDSATSSSRAATTAVTDYSKAASAAHKRLTANLLKEQAERAKIEAASEAERLSLLQRGAAEREATAKSAHARMQAQLVKSQAEATAATLAAESKRAEDLMKVREANNTAALASHARLQAKLVKERAEAAAVEIAEEARRASELQKVREANSAAAIAAHSRMQAQLASQRQAAHAKELADEAAQAAALEQARKNNRAAALQTYSRIQAQLIESQKQRAQAESEGLSRRQATFNRQLQLTDQYHKKDLAARVRHLQQIQRIMEAEAALPAGSRRSTSQLAREFGIVSLRNLNSLPSMQRELESMSNGHRRLASSTTNSTSAIRAHTTSMRDAHAVARGLSGSLGALWLTYGNLMPLLGAAAVGSTMRSTVQVGKDLEYRLKFIEALGNRAVNPEEMMPQVLGSMKTPLEAAEALQALAQAGMRADQSLAALGTTMQLSTLGELAISDAAIAVTGTLAAFNLSAAESSRVGDVFAKAAATSNTTVAKITESMKQASTAAAQYNISVEEVSAALAVMAKRNITGSMAGTSYRNMLKELYTPIARGAKAMEQLGLSAYKADGSMKPLSEVLKEVRDRLVGMNEASRNAALEAMFGERGGRAMRPILDDLDEYLSKVSEMEDATGFLAEANEKLIDTVEGASNRFTSTLQQSYTKAFNNVSTDVKGLILTFDQLVASDGFVSAIEGGARTFVALGEAVARSGDAIKIAAVSYVAFKAAGAASVAISKVQEFQERSKAAATDRSTAATNAQTLAIKANTAAESQNAAAKAAGALTEAGKSAAKATASASGVARILGIMSRLTPVLGWVSLGYMAVTAAMDHYDKQLNKESRSMDKLLQKRDQELETLRKLADEAEKAYQRRLQGVDSDEQLAENVEAARRSEEESVTLAQAAVDAEKEKQRYSLQSIAAYEEQRKKQKGIVDQSILATRERSKIRYIDFLIAEENNKIEQSKEKQLELEGKLQEAIDKNLAKEAERVRLMKAQERLKALNEGSRVVSRFEQLDQRYTILAGKAEAGVASENELKLLKELNRATGGGTSGKTYQNIVNHLVDHEGTIDPKTLVGLNAAFEKLAAPIHALEETFTLSSSGSGGSGSRELISNVSLIKQRYDQQKSLLASVRDVQVKGIKELEKAGAYSTSEAAEKVAQVWDAYTTATIAQAHQAATQIRSLDKGSEYLRELSAIRVEEDAHHERAVATQKAQNEEILRGYELQAAAMNAQVKLTGDLAKIREQVEQDGVKRRTELSKAYMTSAEVAAVEARVEAEGRYNDKLNEQIKLWEELVARKGVDAALTDPVGQAVQSNIDRLRSAQSEAGVRAYGEALEDHMREQTVASGVERLFAQYRDEAQKTGDHIQKSLGQAFDSMGNALSNFVATGKLNFRDLTVSILQDMAKMAAQAALNPIFASIIKVGTGLVGGGIAPDTSYAPNVSAFFQSYKGNAFAGGRVIPFNKGGAFTNTVVNKPTRAPMAMFGDGLAEAIMPLTRLSDGSLGVRALPHGVEGAGGTVINVEVNTVINSDGSSQTDTQSNQAAANRFGTEMRNAVLDVISRETTRQGGIINKAIRGTA